MNAEFLRTEAERAEEAELASEEQLRRLTALIDRASSPEVALTATDCAKVVAAALALNERLHERSSTLQLALKRVPLHPEPLAGS